VSCAAACAFTLVAYVFADGIPSVLEGPVVWLVYPGFIVRGLFSPGELGWQDWRDVILLAGGSGVIWGTVVTSVVGALRIIRKLTSQSGAA
jgi:hypothetical protein